MLSQGQTTTLLELAEKWAALEYDAGINSLYENYDLVPLRNAEREYKEFLRGLTA